MTFNSLSAAHSTVGKILNKWLVYDARDKAQDETSLEETDWEQHFQLHTKGSGFPGKTTLPTTYQEKEKNKGMWNTMNMSTHRKAWKSVIGTLPGGKGESKKDGSNPEGPKDVNKVDVAEGQSTSKATSREESAPLAEKIESRGLSPRSPSQSRSSPLKRSITISPVAAQDGPVNKRRKLIEQPVGVDICQDSQFGSSPPVNVSRLDDDESIEHQDALMVSSQFRSASPVQDSTFLAVESPEAVEHWRYATVLPKQSCP
ncbi:hypothetical protein QFC20_004873 [Naganishia adeliensis]|uniref:Uncharacterized protein n=1 Tax=Naganishia adeliensis TaxID=92952 RepID=A0ACC2VU91_9TREE|nr:hypothetical protein QFC20_004873 [Naganishia adeliensis]